MELNDNWDNDNELIYYIRENNEEAVDLLYQKYAPLIHKEINRVKKRAWILKVDPEDIAQEASLAFSKAINSYNPETDVKFQTFATLCIKRGLNHYLEKYDTIKSKILSSSVALDTKYNNSDKTLLETIKGGKTNEPLVKMMIDEEVNETIKRFEELTEIEKEVVTMSLNEMTVEEIAKKLNISVKQVYNTLYRARKKLKKINS